MSPEDAERLVEQLLYQPPASEAELDDRLASVREEEVRGAVLARVERGAVDEIDAVVVGNLLDRIGLGEARDRLVDCVSGRLTEAAGEQRRARRAALVVLAMNEDFGVRDPETTFGLEPEGYAELAASVYGSLFEFARTNLDVVYEIGDMLLGEPEGMRGAIIGQLEAHREEAGAEAGVVYRALLCDGAYRDLWPFLTEAVVEAGVGRDARWLQRAADRLEEQDQRWARRFREAASELRPRVGAAEEPPEGFALVGTPDGSGTFPLFVFTERDGGAHVGHNLVFRRHPVSIREGFYVANIVRGEVADLVDDIETSRATLLTEVPVEVGIRLAHRLLAEIDGLRAFPPEIRLTVYHLDQLYAGGVELPEPDSADGLDTDFVVECFREEDCFESWFFDRATLEGVEALPVPDRGEDDGAWRRETARRLAESSELRARIVSNLRFLARWYLFDGDGRAASQFAALADAADESLATSPAMDLLLDHTLQALREMEDYADAFVGEILGDESLRANLRDAHLDGNGLGAGRASRYLDYMEVTYRTLEQLRSEFPAELRPTAEQMERASGPVGLALADGLEADTTAPVDDPAARATERLRESGVDDEIVDVCVSELLTNTRLLAMAR